MAQRLLRLSFRSMSLILMLIALFYHWECQNLTTPANFMMSGVYGAYIVITLGLLMEESINKQSDKLIEASYLMGGILLNLMCTFFVFADQHGSCGDHDLGLNKAFVSMFCAAIYFADLVFLYVK